MKFHEKLLQQRKTAGMTQSELAEKLNVSRQAVSRWEMGTAMPEVENLIMMSELFGVSLDYLLKDKEERSEAKQEEIPQKVDFWDRLRQMRPLEFVAIAALLLLAVWLILRMLESYRWATLMTPFVIVGGCVAAVLMAVHLNDE